MTTFFIVCFFIIGISLVVAVIGFALTLLLLPFAILAGAFDFLLPERFRQ